MENEANLSIYRAARTIKRRENTLYNALRSIYEDSLFVSEISQLWPQLPLLANLRCGLWYSSNFHSTCYFKSTDGHTNNWSFNTSRLNLHVALLAGQKGGCIIVDSTRRGKRFPDSMSKTIPIWTCVLNRSIHNYREKMHSNGVLVEGHVMCEVPMDANTVVEINRFPIWQESSAWNEHGKDTTELPIDWDCSLHLPLWVSDTEKASISERLEEWTRELGESGADIASLASSLKKPLRPLWISQKTVIWINEVPDHDSWDFTPIILLSASSSSGLQHRTTSEFSWNYIPGAGDDEESWARGLSPYLFWSHAYDIINAGPEVCNQKVADIVEKDRVHRAHRGQVAPQVVVKPHKHLGNSINIPQVEPVSSLDMLTLKIDLKPSDEGHLISWLGSTNLAVGASQHAAKVSNVDCILNCDQWSITVSVPNPEAYLHLPIVNSKLDRFSLLKNLPPAVNFAKLNMSKGKTLLVCCQTGEDIGVCVCLAILISLFNPEGIFDDGKSLKETSITKSEMRRRLVFICQYATNARPSRGNLKQVYSFLTGGGIVGQV